ncbi:MAG TPA: DnaA/Hda family protein, partial [Polyangia bacterium]
MSRIWDNALATLEDCIKPHEYELWCRPIVCTGISDDEITLQAPNAYLRTYFSLNYLPLVYDRLETELKRRPRVTFQPDGAPAASDEVEPPPALPAAPAPAPTPGLEAVEPPAGPSDVVPHYTFDTFVVGPSNQLAHAAARAVAEHPATKWNPLYIYGGVGLGKTHLLMAIANEILRRNPGWRVSYVSTERFVNESIAAIQSH